MKMLVTALLFTVAIFISIGELNTAGNPESSSHLGVKRPRGRPRGSGGGPGSGPGGPRHRGMVPPKFRPGERHVERVIRDPDEKIEFMNHEVHLWLSENGTVVQADFEGNNIPKGINNFYRYNNFLVRLFPIGGHTTVIYVYQNETLMAVRAPNPTQLDATDKAESSSRLAVRRPRGRPRGTGAGLSRNRTIRRPKFQPGERHVDPLKRDPDVKVDFMEHEVFLWLAANGTVLQADFKGNTLPTGIIFYRNHNFLVRLYPIGGHTTVIYVYQNETLMAVRAPNPTPFYYMEPYPNLWFINYFGKYFRVDVDEATDRPIAVDFVDENQNLNGHVPDKVIFPWIEFYVYRGRRLTDITGVSLKATLPLFV